MVHFSKLAFLLAAAESALASPFPASRKLSYGKCPDSETPPKQNGYEHERCPEGYGIKASDLITCSSGSSGTDHRETDNDIFRNLINYVGLSDHLDNLGPHCTCFIPTDLGVVDTAKSLGFYSSGYDEAGAEHFLKQKYSKHELIDIVLYHFSCDERYTFRELQQKQWITTEEGESMILSQPAGSTPNCDERVALLDEYRKHVQLSKPDAKLHNKHRDLDTANCILHVTKALSLPAAVLPGRTPHPTPAPTEKPSGTPSAQPSSSPTGAPSSHPSASPTENPSAGPSASPSSSPTEEPSFDPSAGPSASPSSSPTEEPSFDPSSSPSSPPTASPTAAPTFSCGELLDIFEERECPLPPPTTAQRCINSGGNVTTILCPPTTTDFPNTCSNENNCGCPGCNTNTTACSCPEGTCFDGKDCTSDRVSGGPNRIGRCFTDGQCIYSHNSSLTTGGLYLPTSDCTWRIEQESNMTVELFELECGGPFYDDLTVRRDVNGTRTVTEYSCGENGNDIEKLPTSAPDINGLTVLAGDSLRFRSDSSGQYLGFKICFDPITLADVADIASTPEPMIVQITKKV